MAKAAHWPDTDAEARKRGEQTVSTGPASRLRYWCSPEYLRIPPLHSEFRIASSGLQTGSIEGSSGVEPRAFTLDLPIRLRALYAQQFRTTLAPSVLPRLLARS